jgi:hypothetical protein
MILIRKILFFILITVLVYGCGAGNQDKNNLPADLVKTPTSASGADQGRAMPRIAFEEEVHDFGRVIEGEKITYAFKFTNDGKAELLITDVKSSCGCTVAEFTKEALKPGERGLVKITFDSSNRKGFQNKSITVISNTIPSTTVLKIKAQVIVPEQF